MSSDGQRVLVVDDEPQIVRALKVILRGAGYVTQQAETKQEALDAVAVRPPDAMVLDLILPDGSGVDVCKEIRRWSGLPIIVLSAVGDEREKVRALDAGADDYITKPFGTDELLARLRAALRRVTEESEPRIEIGDVEIDLEARQITSGGEPVHLTPIEFELLRVLVRNRGRLLTHRMLLTEVWGPGYAEDVQSLRTHIARLRAKIEPEGPRGRPRYILTDPGVGYRFAA